MLFSMTKTIEKDTSCIYPIVSTMDGGASSRNF